MGVINEPRYDEDLVTKSYLDQTIENITGTIDGELSKLDSSVSRRAQNFGSEPTPPYYVNDTYMDGADIYICTTERLIGDFNAADWSKASNYTDDSTANTNLATAKTYAETKANDARIAAEAVAVAQANLAKTEADAYADGIVSTEEAERIAQDTATLNAAKVDAAAKATAAENAAKGYADAQLTNFAIVVDGDISDLQTQIDGKITTWFYAAAPTTANVPASTWTTKAMKDAHLGDLYYNTSTGQAYRWKVVSTTYDWELITDNRIITALANAATAKDVADSKRRVFGSTPTPPYDVNDLWVQGTGGDIMRCITASTAAYSAEHWVKAVKYTDDTLASSMNKVFVNTPTPPYKIGDLWTTGPNGVLYRCKTSKTLGQSYNIADWENATSYDDTETVVQHGLVTTGTVQVVQGGTVAAGVTGQTSGDGSVRFWAGSSFDNRGSAPFRVTQAGAINATSGVVGGCVIDAYGMYSGSGDSVAGIGVIGARYAFWAGKNANESSSAPFRVGHDGALYASSATIKGVITATSGSFSGTISAGSGTIGGLEILPTKIRTTNKYTGFAASTYPGDPAFWAGNVDPWENSGWSTNMPFYVTNQGYLKATNVDIKGAITATSGTFANFSGGGLTLNSSGALKYYDNPGFLYCGGNTINHPYVSALNVAATAESPGSGNNPGNQSISFRNSNSRTTAGSTIAYISHGWNGSTRFHTINNMNISSTGATSISAGTYARLYSGTYLRLTAGTSTTEGSASGNLYLAASGSVYASNAAANYSYSRVRTVQGDYSSKNIKKNIKKFKNRDYEKSIDLLKKLNIYNYDYKYKGLYDRQKQYGFIIDEIEKIDNKFFDIKEEKARIKNKSVDFGDPHAKGKKITVKNYNPDVLDKYLLTVCKAQQMKIDELEKRLEKLEGGK